MKQNHLIGHRVATSGGRAWLSAIFIAFGLGGCAAPEPVVSKSVAVDEFGREVIHCRVCEQRGLPFMKETVCRNETVVSNFCYRSLARVDCYEQPVAGPAVSRNPL